MTQRGIILRHYLPERYSCVLFDERLGHIRAIIAREKEPPRMPTGSLIEYEVSLWRERPRISHIQLIAVPFTTLCHDLTFLHQILELLLKFLPEAAESADLFAIILILYNPQYTNYLQEELTRKLFLCKLLSLIGVYPDETIFRQSPAIQRLLLLPIAQLNNSHPHINSDTLNVWLLGCFSASPEANMLRTFM